MSVNNPKPGFNAAAEYLVPGLPFVTSSQAPVAGSEPLRISFPQVTRDVTIVNHGANNEHLKFGFTRLGTIGAVTGSFFRLNGGNQGDSLITLNVRIKDMWFVSDTASLPHFSVYAGLTMIDRNQMPTLTGSTWPGVG